MILTHSAILLTVSRTKMLIMLSNSRRDVLLLSILQLKEAGQMDTLQKMTSLNYLRLNSTLMKS